MLHVGHCEISCDPILLIHPERGPTCGVDVGLQGIVWTSAISTTTTRAQGSMAQLFGKIWEDQSIFFTINFEDQFYKLYIPYCQQTLPKECDKQDPFDLEFQDKHFKRWLVTGVELGRPSHQPAVGGPEEPASFIPKCMHPTWNCHAD